MQNKHILGGVVALPLMTTALYGQPVYREPTPQEFETHQRGMDVCVDKILQGQGTPMKNVPECDAYEAHNIYVYPANKPNEPSKICLNVGHKELSFGRQRCFFVLNQNSAKGSTESGRYTDFELKLSGLFDVGVVDGSR
ncbi:MAG: hypothetical protein WAZ18_02450 [Alphaproteobacteria bacterium]